MRRPLFLPAFGLLLVGFFLCGGLSAVNAQQPNFPVVKEYRIERSVSPQAVACIECHRATTAGVFADWAMSRHASANITCLDCHLVQPGEEDIAKGHEKYYGRSDLPYGESIQSADRLYRHSQGLLTLPSR